MTHDGPEIAWALSNVLQPELNYLVDEFMKEQLGAKTLKHFIYWVDNKKKQYGNKS